MPLTENRYINFEANIQKVWDAVHKDNYDYLNDLFKVQGSKRARELHKSVGTFGRMKDFDGSVFYDEFSEGYDKEYRHGAKTTGVAVDWRLVDDEEYTEINNRTDGLSYGVYKTLQYDGASMYNNAFTAGYNGPDGVSLCNASHHLVAGDDVQSNTGTDDMTVASVDATKTAGMSFKDDKGDPMPVVFDQIICGAYWDQTAAKICGSNLEAFTADNQINPHKGKLSYLVCPWITGKKWFMTNKHLQKNGMGANFFMRQDPRKLDRDSEFDALILKWRAVGRWSWGWDNWFWCYGHNPAQEM